MEAVSEIGSVKTPRNILIGFALILIATKILSFLARRRLEDAESA